MDIKRHTIFMVPNPDELQQLSELYKAMGDYTRMRILWHLMEKDCCVSELAEKLQTTESAVSHQLRALRMTRLVCSRKSGKKVIYSLQDEHIGWILEETYAHISESSRGDFLSPLTPPYMPFGIRRFNITSKHDAPCNSQDSL